MKRVFSSRGQNIYIIEQYKVNARRFNASFLISEILLGRFDDYTREGEQTNEVRDYHESVESLSDVPQEAEVKCCADDSDKRIDDEERLNELVAKDELHASRSIETPADNRREGETAHRNSGED